MSPANVSSPVDRDELVRLMAAVRDGGGVWRGIQKGLPERGLEHHVLFDDAALPPNKSSSMALPLSAVTAEAVRRQIEEMRRRYKKD